MDVTISVINADSKVQVHTKFFSEQLQFPLFRVRAKNLSINGTGVFIGFEGRDEEKQDEAKCKDPNHQVAKDSCNAYKNESNDEYGGGLAPYSCGDHITTVGALIGERLIFKTGWC